MKPMRDLLKHSSIYAIGQILTRIASVLLLPLYTHCLTPADYGITAIMDLTATILSLMVGAGMVTAVTRYHFEQQSERDQDALWWTGFTYLAIASVLVLLPLWLGRQNLADLTLGSQVALGARYYEYTLATIFVQVIGQLVDAYLRVRKWSGVFVSVSIGRLILNVTLNVFLLVGLQKGVEGLLLGNLLASCAHTLVLLAIFIRTRGGYTFRLPLAVSMFRFSLPLVVTALLSMLMHEADRYLLRALVSLEDVGVYALAHKIGFAVNTLCLLPFASIWHVAIYDINRLPDANETFAKIFRWFSAGLGILLMGAALTVHPILPLLTPDAYGQAIDLIAVILLGFYVFGMQLQFEVPAMLEKRTGLLIPGSVAGVIVNVSSNLFLVPRIGLWGAACTGVLTYSAFTVTTLLLCRRIRPIAYPWKRFLTALVGFCASYLGLRFVAFPLLGVIGQICASIACCCLWSVILFGNDALAWWASQKKNPAVLPRDKHSPEVAVTERCEGTQSVDESQVLCVK
jgi:O-antigen/teichoic acid export membrane protein